jgi:PKD repeat protein
MEKLDGIGSGRGRGMERRALALCALLATVSPGARGATYLPLPDPALAGNAPVVVRVRAGESSSRLAGPGAGPAIVTETDLDVLEVLKGSVLATPIRLVLPGGQVEEQVVWIPGRPTFVPGQEAILFLVPVSGRPGEYAPTEFGLSVFDILEDPEGRHFAVRTMFQAGEQEVLAPDGAELPAPDHVRELDSFLAALRAVGRGEPMPPAAKASPAGPLRLPVGAGGGPRALWVNLGGPEGGNLFRWNWSGAPGCAASPNGVVHPVGTQTNLTDGSNGRTHVQNAVTQWAGVPGADVRYSYSASSGNVAVNLDVDSVSGGWSTPMGCGLRRSTCASGYTVAVFRSGVLHEVGHTVGLGHPDEGESVFSTTTPAEWDAAVMRSTLAPSHPDQPQSDDIAAIQYYYGTGAPPPAPVASFTSSPGSPAAGQTVQFTDTSTNTPTSWSWTFGDGGSSSQRNPAHAYASAGTYTVTLTATNASGSDSESKPVTVAAATAPVAAFGFSPTSPVTGQSVSFFDQSTGGPTSWLWTFGDGSSSTSPNPVKAYAAAGTYTVTLTATNASGSDSESKPVTVAAAGIAPAASFTFSPSSPAPGQTVQFTDTSTGGPTSWSWDFGDGTFSAAQNPAKVYGGAATLTVRLTATNAFGSGTTTRQITITAGNRAPTAVPDVYSVASGATLSVGAPGVLANDTDPDGDPLAASLVSPPSGGTFGLQPSGAFAFTPPAGFVGTASFTYRATDAKGAASNAATVTITVTSSETERVVPIVLDAFGVGSSRFRSELVLANRGTAASAVELTYTAATALGATGTGTVNETLGAGRQLVVDDALAYLRSKGLPIPQAAVGASQGGTLRVRFRGLSAPDAGAAFARTTALLPEGRAGVAYPALTPGEWLTPDGQHVFGLRETAEARSNLALVNLSSTADVGLRVTLQSGTAGDRRTYVLPETIWLGPLQWTQLSSVLSRAGFTNGWALVERSSGSGPFYAYGVFNDYGTNDGSFIDPIPAASGVPARTVPVILELGIYSTQLILTNPSASTVAVELGYVESLSAAGVARRTGTDLLQPREQKMVEAIPHLRALGVDVGEPGGSYAGSVVASFFQSGQPVNGFAGARTKSPGQPGGSYGVYYSGLGTGQMAASEAWVYGLKQDGDSRTNVAVAHGEPGGGPIVLQAQVFDGETGANAGGTGNVTLKAGQWFQWNQLLASVGLGQGYVRVFRVSGTSPFLAYGVVNDGGSERPGTNDGSYVPMLAPR